ncbi:NAD(P)/FAD-dependent oxidoreductase [Novosphingobium sp. JCM 18896]|uniref:NAD(P)/FAD-dependent oxidoreductase n=1 Tax=Novosphingobium sp. JCM 18896 TaxID=2989731 RepID=UPI002222014E|nr:FAD-dependent oxidoreductase [Novosphingobium sp. JCM 18896]MCW1432487.1 FAD-dependent oxidoreductase [Novosphingobium sp. JCM 18896]
MSVAIIGAGISGLACAAKLTAQGHDVTLFDKGRRPGGRLASVSIDNMTWDLGAPGFVAHSAEFRREAEDWRRSGWLAPPDPSSPDLMVGAPTMASLVSAQCANHNARFGANVRRLERRADGWIVAGDDFAQGPFSTVVLALPAEQAAPLLSLHDLGMARPAAMVQSAPCWAVMVAFAQPAEIARALTTSGKTFAALVHKQEAPADGAPDCWTLHASQEWSRAHLERPREDVAQLLFGALRELVDGALPPASFLKAHRWRFAIPYGGPGTTLWNDRLKLGVCGDWCLGSNIEAAWLSGHRLGAQLVKCLGRDLDATAA